MANGVIRLGWYGDVRPSYVIARSLMEKKFGVLIATVIGSIGGNLGDSAVTR
jgi:hypothetical protein